MAEQFDDLLLDEFAHKFYGYGNYGGQFWFIGMEEGGGDSFAEVAKRLEAWALRGRREIDDVAEYLAAIGITHLHNDHPKLSVKMNKIQLPKFRIYEEEAAFWDNLDTADMMEDDGEWFHFDVADEQESGRDEKTIRRYRRRHDDDDHANDRIPSDRCIPPAIVPPNPDIPHSKIMIAVMAADDLADESEFWYQLADQGLAMGYGDDEPDYSLAVIKEPNPEYKP